MKTLGYLSIGFAIGLSLILGVVNRDELNKKTTSNTLTHEFVRASEGLRSDFVNQVQNRNLERFRSLEARQDVLEQEVIKLKDILINPNGKEVCGD